VRSVSKFCAAATPRARVCALSPDHFELHPRLVVDFHLLGRCGAVHVLLRRNATLPWFILVPESPALELFELPAALRRELDGLTDEVAKFVKREFAADKMNIAAIGNIVPQIHVHVIGRRRDDCCWPQAAWGAPLPEAAYAAATLADLQAQLSAAVGLQIHEAS
jgi:diadenosine tetraphosphate (Ap4A) HIT family hydrolase